MKWGAKKAPNKTHKQKYPRIVLGFSSYLVYVVPLPKKKMGSKKKQRNNLLTIILAKCFCLVGLFLPEKKVSNLLPEGHGSWTGTDHTV